MAITAEEEVVLLYALHRCGGNPTKSRATNYILTNNLLTPRPNDEQLVATGETRIINRIAQVRRNLRASNEVGMPHYGTWQLTDKGKRRLFLAARMLYAQQRDGLGFIDELTSSRYSADAFQHLRALGAELSEQKRSTVQASSSKVRPLGET